MLFFEKKSLFHLESNHQSKIKLSTKSHCGAVTLKVNVCRKVTFHADEKLSDKNQRSKYVHVFMKAICAARANDGNKFGRTLEK